MSGRHGELWVLQRGLWGLWGQHEELMWVLQRGLWWVVLVLSSLIDQEQSPANNSAGYIDSIYVAMSGD